MLFVPLPQMLFSFLSEELYREAESYVSHNDVATSMPDYVSSWCRHGFESHSQPFLLIYLEAELSYFF